jgi:hypothetical protein
MSGPPTTAERRPHEGSGSSASGLARQLQSTPQDRQNEVWHAMATVFRVVGTRGRIRSVIVVRRCPWCSRSHVHTGKPDFVSGKRTASCHAGRYLVHTGVLEGEVAA